MATVTVNKPYEIHIENRTTHYQVIIAWGLLNVEYVSNRFASKKLAREYINNRFGVGHGIPVLA